MNARLELERPRDLSALLNETVRLYGRHAGTFLAIAAAFVVPVELIVSGLGLEQLTASYDDSPSAVQTAIPAAVSFLVVSPLVTATCIHALRELGAGQRPRAGPAIQSGLDAFTPVFGAILLAAAGILLGLLALVIPGLYLAVRWYFVPQVVVVEGVRGPAALAASSDLVQGRWWRTLGIVAVANLVAALPGLLLVGPLGALADSTDRALPLLIGEMLTQVVAAPFVALLSTLLYYDLRARRA